MVYLRYLRFAKSTSATSLATSWSFYIYVLGVGREIHQIRHLW